IRTGRRKVRADIEKIVLDTRQYSVDLVTGTETRLADKGIGFVDSAIGIDAKVMLGAARAANKPCSAAIAGLGIDGVELDHLSGSRRTASGRRAAGPAPQPDR